MEIDGKFEKLEELNRKKEDLLAAIGTIILYLIT